ncbi:restriction endonuclease subunit S [Mycolicibacterium chitae]|uniref:restriction endonuclease subunit S n=1 Tax=Mycolicibacterium chitae TaxID=1792 RepID=UPI002E0EBF0A
MSRIPLNQLGSWIVNLPDLPTQCAVSDVLGALDDKIAANRQVIDASQALSAAAVSATRWPTRPVPLGDITTSLVRGAAPKYSDTGYVVLNQKCVRNGLVDVTLARTTSTLPTVPTKVLRQNDVLVNSTGQGTLGRTSRWIRSDAEVTADSHISIVRFDSSLADEVFAGTVLTGMERDIESLAEGSTGQTELRRDLLATLELRLPDIDTQRRIGGIVSAMSDAINARQDENQVLARTRDELLPLLMNGKITVKQAEAKVEKVL